MAANTRHSTQGICNDAPRHTVSSPLVILSACLVLLGAGGFLFIRVYFVHGGQRLWVATMVQVAGWPLLLPPICASLLLRRRRTDGGGISDHLLPPRLAGAVAVLGALFAVACFALSLGSRALPLSMSSLLQATQLAFNAVFSFLFAGLRFTPFTANAVVLLTVGSAALGVQPSPEKKPGSGGSWAGFAECLSSAALLGLVLPLVDAAVSRYYGGRTPPYAAVMQIQAVMGAAATAVCLAGMAAGGDSQAVPGEAAAFGLGEARYYLLLAAGTVSLQLSNLGLMGLITCSSSLLAGMMMALVLPLTEVLAVVFLGEEFDGVKGIALVLSLWGFVSYLYGESLHKKKMEAADQGTESISNPLMAASRL